jgi:hypothetical protein
MAKLRTIFIHPSLPERTVKNPAGWKALELSLERDQIFHTLVEYFKGSFMWYGNALTTIKEIEATDGIKAQIGVRFEVSFKMDIWVTLYTGMLKIAQKEEIYTGIILNKITCPVIRDDFWSKFFNRYKTPVNLESTTDMDGGTRTAVAKTTVAMRGQVIRSRYERRVDYYDTNNQFSVAQATGLSTFYLIWDGTAKIDEVQKREEYGTQISAENPTESEKYFLKTKFKGTYTLTGNIKFSLIFGASVTYDVQWFYGYRKNGVLTETQIGTTNSGTNSFVSQTLGLAFTDSEDLIESDEIYIYGKVVLSASPSVTYFPDFDTDSGVPFVPTYTTFDVLADTVFPDSVTDAYLIKQACEATISKYVGADSVVISTKFSDTTFNRNAIFRGKHNRGYTFSQKEMSTSFEEIYQGIDPMFNLCLGYTKVSGVNKIFIEDKSYAYNPTVIVNIPNCRNIVRKNDLERYFKTIEIGYSKSLSESESGIDDPQTKQTRNADLPTFGKDEKIVSRFIAASLAIERSRRNRVEQGKDDRLDEDMMIVSVIPGSPWTLEFNENFTSILGLLNSTKRANVRHTVMRLFKRWQNFINPSLSVGEEFTFGRGEGNYDVTTTISGSDYESASGTVSEKDAFVAWSSRLWSNKIIEVTDVEMPFGTYEQIVANKENAIGVSRTESNFVPCFILDFNYKLFDGKASFVVLQANEDEI